MSVSVGSSNILHHYLVKEAPESVNRPIPVPSVYRDERGEIHNLLVNMSQRYNVLYTKEGAMRSGDIHSCTQHDFIFLGRVRVWRLRDDATTHYEEFGPNSYVEIPPYTPHIFEFLEETVMAEWWDGPFHAWFYEPYRSLVEASFVRTKPGIFESYYIPRNKLEVAWSSLLTGAAIGMTFGWLVGRRRG